MLHFSCHFDAFLVDKTHVDYPLELTHFEDISRVDRFTSFHEIQYFERFLDSIFLTSDTLPQRGLI